MLAATETSLTLLLKGKQETRQNLVKELTNINADLSTKGITIHIPVLFKFDTRGFEPENITLKTLNGQLAVQAKRQETDGEYHCARQLDMTVRIPEEVNVEELKGYISGDGFLHMESLYTAPAIEQKEEFREIPITHE
ncbi:heat shock protein 30-like [Paramacrobiotus metropolitanus]|uniref:heat shock protein 30-like n=1 Tax=Paramacrobiotus metropolitanus TaxID=2943436 RepID=UPI0024462F9A|nr:heat shock protein 30-like [Paramacrobiotus metropolitanus]